MPTAWHLRRLRVDRAWRYTKGAGISVAVLDSGCAEADALGQVRHLDHSGRQVKPEDVSRSSHGTACCGLIGSKHSAVQGVAPDAELISIRITGRTGKPMFRRVADAFHTLARLKIDVASCSLTLGRFDGRLAEAVETYLAAGGTIVAAAGEKKNPNAFPKDAKRAVVVGGVTPRDRGLTTTNRGHYIDVAAPAAELLTVDKVGRPRKFGKTSGATALIAGVCALALADAEARGQLAQVALGLERLLRNSCDGVGAKTITGRGVVDAHALIQNARSLS